MIRLPKESKVYMCHYTHDEYNMTMTYILGYHCLVCLNEGQFICAFIDLNDEDVQFIIGAQTGRLTNELANKYGFSSVEEVYDELEYMGTSEELGQFFKNCKACEDWETEDFGRILEDLQAGPSIWL